MYKSFLVTSSGGAETKNLLNIPVGKNKVLVLTGFSYTWPVVNADGRARIWFFDQNFSTAALGEKNLIWFDEYNKQHTNGEYGESLGKMVHLPTFVPIFDQLVLWYAETTSNLSMYVTLHYFYADCSYLEKLRNGSRMKIATDE